MFWLQFGRKKKHEYQPSLEDLPLRPAHNKNRHKLRPSSDTQQATGMLYKKNVNSKNKVAK